MGFFDKLREKKAAEAKARAEAEERRKAEEIARWQTKAKEYYDKLKNSYDTRDIEDEINKSLYIGVYSHDDKTCKMDNGIMRYFGLKDSEFALYTNIYKLYFGEQANKLDYNFANDLMGPYGFPPFVFDQRLDPLNFNQFRGLQWAKKYLEHNPDIQKLTGELVYKANMEYSLMEGMREEAVLNMEGLDVLTDEDIRGSSFVKDIIYVPGLFDKADDDRPGFRLFLHYYKTVMNPKNITSMIKRFRKDLAEELLDIEINEELTPEVYKKLMRKFFVDEDANKVREYRYAISNVGALLELNLPSAFPHIFGRD